MNRHKIVIILFFVLAAQLLFGAVGVGIIIMEYVSSDIALVAVPALPSFLPMDHHHGNNAGLTSTTAQIDRGSTFEADVYFGWAEPVKDQVQIIIDAPDFVADIDCPYVLNIASGEYRSEQFAIQNPAVTPNTIETLPFHFKMRLVLKESAHANISGSILVKIIGQTTEYGTAYQTLMVYYCGNAERLSFSARSMKDAEWKLALATFFNY